MRLLLVITSSLWFLAACGLKGPLYLPLADPESPREETERVETRQRDRIKGAEDSVPPPIN